MNYEKPQIPEDIEKIEENSERIGIVDKVRKLINSRVAEAKLPTKEGLGYESTMGIYGGKLVEDEDGRLVYDTRGLWSQIDRMGDRWLRTFDEHYAKNPIKMAMRRPMQFLKSLPFIADSKRFRGTSEQTIENVKRLKLEEIYGSHPWGVEIKDRERFSHAIGLQDVMRQDEIKSPVLDKIDRFDAEARAVKYLRTLHDTVGAVAECNAWSFLFDGDREGNLGESFLMIPTEIFNPEKEISDIEKKATDLLDFIASMAIEELHRSEREGDEENMEERVSNAVKIALDNYGDSKITSLTAALIRRGRLTLPGDLGAPGVDGDFIHNKIRPVFSAHNTQRLGAKAESSVKIKEILLNECENYLKQSK